MRTNPFINAILLVLFAAAGAAAQQCPQVNASGPDSVPAGEAVTFTANISGGDEGVTPTFNWTISAGTIEKGQGTSAISVDTTSAEGSTITATVDVGGYDQSCGTTASITTTVERRPEARKVDEFSSSIPAEDQNARLDNFAAELESDSTAVGYVIAYGGRTSSPAAARTALTQAKTYLTKTRKLPTARIATVNGGYREEAQIELFIAPAGAAAPTVAPTLDPSEVQPPKPQPPAKPEPRPPLPTKKPVSNKTF